MKNYQNDFGPFEGKIWLNTASEGAIPRVSAKAVQEAIEWKLKPFYLTHKRFRDVPAKLKEVIGRLMNVAPEDVILGNSATYGIHLLANGLPLKKGDEILLMQNDFPTDILTWLGLEKKGVLIHQLRLKNYVLTPKELIEHLTSKTRVVCLSHVHTFTGHVTDIEALGKICRSKGVVFIVNLSQSLGTRPIDLGRLSVDAITTAGFKWLLGPYGTGFCWIKPALREKLEYNQSYWVNVLSAEALEGTDKLTLPDSRDARKYDVFGTANFFNFCPFTASIEYLLNVGIETVQEHNDQLVKQVLDGLNDKEFRLISPQEAHSRSTLVVFSHRNPEKNKAIFASLLARGIYLALWKGNLRIAPHIFNTPADIKAFLTTLDQLA